MNRQSCCTSDVLSSDYLPPRTHHLHHHQAVIAISYIFYAHQSLVLPMPITPHLSPDVCQSVSVFFFSLPLCLSDSLFFRKSYHGSLSVPIMSYLSRKNTETSKQTTWVKVCHCLSKSLSSQNCMS